MVMKRDSHGSERGIALALVLLAGMLLSISAAVAITAASHRFQSMSSQRGRDLTFYAGEAGLQLAVIKLQGAIPPFNNPGLWVDTNGDAWPDHAETYTINGRSVTVLVTRTATGPDKFRLNVTAL